MYTGNSKKKNEKTKTTIKHESTTEISAKRSELYLFIHKSNVYNSFKTLFTYMRSIEGIARRKTRKQKLA